MPTYEYRCRDCNHGFEIVQAFSDDALTECPQCSGSLRKLFGNIGVSFKGSGFYKTDHGSRAKAGASADSSSSSSSSESSASSSNDSSSAAPASSTASTSTAAPSTT